MDNKLLDSNFNKLIVWLFVNNNDYKYRLGERGRDNQKYNSVTCRSFKFITGRRSPNPHLAFQNI